MVLSPGYELEGSGAPAAGDAQRVLGGRLRAARPAEARHVAAIGELASRKIEEQEPAVRQVVLEDSVSANHNLAAMVDYLEGEGKGGGIEIGFEIQVHGRLPRSDWDRGASPLRPPRGGLDAVQPD